MRRGLFVFMLVIPFVWPIGYARAEPVDKRIEQITTELDRIDNEFSVKYSKLVGEMVTLDLKLQNFTKDIAGIGRIQDDVEKKYKAILHIESKLDSYSSKIDDNSKSIASILATVQNTEKNFEGIRGDIVSSKTIVTWVTLVVSVVVVLVGLFFSKLFLDLYSNYKVMVSKLEVIGKGGTSPPTME